MNQWQSAAWTPNERENTEFTREWARTQHRMGTGSFLGLTASHSFERTTMGLLAEERRIAEAEHEAGTDWDPVEQLGGYDAVSYDVSDLQASHPHAMTEEAFKAAGFDRSGRIAWTPVTTRQRAEIEAETFDRREWEKKLLELNSDTLGRKVLGFGAAFLANIPDPVNLVPVFGSAARGATLGTRVLRGVAEGLATTAITDAAQLPASARRGDDIGFADFALDIIFGGLFGAGTGAVGGLLHNRRVSGLAGEQARLAELLGEAGYENAEAGRLADSAIAHIADMPRRMEFSEAVRRNMAGMDRLGAGKLLDRMMLAIRDGENPDVGKWAEELRLQRAFTVAENIRREQAELATGYDRVRDDPLGGMPDEILATLTPEDIERVLVHRGPAVQQDGEISVQGRALKRVGLSKRGFGLVKVIFLHGEKGTKRQEMPRVQREDVINMPRAIREYAPIIHEVGGNGDGVTRWNIPRADGNYLAIVVGRGQDGPDSRLVSMFVDSPEGPVSPKRNRPESLLPSARLGEGYMADGLGVLSDPASPDGVSATIPTPRSTVNVAELHPDFTAPAPEPEIVPLRMDEAAREDAKMFDAEEFGALDMEASRIAGEGRMTPEDAAELEAAKAELERVDNVENAGLAVLECVMGGLE